MVLVGLKYYKMFCMMNVKDCIIVLWGVKFGFDKF